MDYDIKGVTRKGYNKLKGEPKDNPAHFQDLDTGAHDKLAKKSKGDDEEEPKVTREPDGIILSDEARKQLLKDYQESTKKRPGMTDKEWEERQAETEVLKRELGEDEWAKLTKGPEDKDCVATEKKVEMKPEEFRYRELLAIHKVNLTGAEKAELSRLEAVYGENNKASKPIANKHEGIKRVPEGFVISHADRGALLKEQGIIKSMEEFRAWPILEGVMDGSLDPDDEKNFITDKERGVLRKKIESLRDDLGKRKLLEALGKIGEKLGLDEIEEIGDDKRAA